MPKGTEIDFKVLFESVPGLYVVLLPDFTIVAASDSYMEITGIDRENFIGKGFFEIFPGEPGDIRAPGIANIKHSLQQVLQTKTTQVLPVQKFETLQPDGSTVENFWNIVSKPILNQQQEVLYIIRSVQNVTAFTRLEAKMYEAELQQKTLELQAEQRKRFENFLQIMGDAFVSLNRSWQYTFVNNNSLALMKKTADELLGKTLWEVFPDTAGTVFETNFRKAMEEKITTSFETYYPPYDMWLDVRVYPHADGIAVFYNDVTLRKNSQKQIQALNRDLEQKVKDRTAELEEINKELESFSYSVSHDLRAPLRAIHGYTQMLEEDYGKVLDSEGQRLTKVIKQNASRMGILIDDLLSFSRLGKKEILKSQVDMNALTNAVVTEIRKQHEHLPGIHIDPLHPVMADYSMMVQVMLNLLNNAIKYSSQNKNASITVSSKHENGFYIFSVSDNGVGFDMKYSHKLFGVFQRLHNDNEFEGTGVGLAIVQRIINKHHGKVWAVAEKGKGATFYFALP